MKIFSWILKTELLQNTKLFLLVMFVALLFGFSIGLAFRANEKISELARQTDWGADLAIVPKGISLSDFRDELLNGNVKALLPEALFNTTISIANGQFDTTAFLAFPEKGESEVVVKPGQKEIGTAWIKSLRAVSSWKEQNLYSTPEWGNHVIAGFVASGSPIVMQNLKELIDRKTVAQAFVISEQQRADETKKTQLQKGLSVYSGVLVVLIVLALISLYLWIKLRVLQTTSVLDEIGFSKLQQYNLMTGLTVVTFFIPFVLGLLICAAVNLQF